MLCATRFPLTIQLGSWNLEGITWVTPSSEQAFYFWKCGGVWNKERHSLKFIFVPPPPMGKRLDCTIGLGGTQTWILETLEPVLLRPSVGLLEPVGTAEAYWEIGWNNLPRNLPGTPWCICVHTFVSNSPSFLSTKGLLPVGSLAGCAPYLSLTSLIPSPSCQQFSKPCEALQPHPNLGPPAHSCLHRLNGGQGQNE